MATPVRFGLGISCLAGGALYGTRCHLIPGN
jgi:hypothetical protein